MSCPALKALPAPVSTMRRVCESRAAPSKARLNSRSTSTLNALARSGRFSVRVSNPSLSPERSVGIEKKTEHRARSLGQIVVRAIVIAVIELVFDVFLVEINPQQQHMSFRGFDVARGQDRRGLFEPHIVAIMQMHMILAAPCPVTTLDQRVPVEGAQARQRRDQYIRAFVEPHRPTVVHLLEDRRRAFDNRNFFIHSLKNIP